MYIRSCDDVSISYHSLSSPAPTGFLRRATLLPRATTSTPWPGSDGVLPRWQSLAGVRGQESVVRGSTTLHSVAMLPKQREVSAFHARRWALLFLLVSLILLLPGCTPRPSYAETQATAAVRGCWPDGYPTPRSVTSTPVSSPAATAQAAPTSTALPSTTPYPRCPPAPGATAVPWPTAVPPRPAYPTMEPRAWVGGSARQTTLQLPEVVLALDLAAHPSAGWPALASVVWSGDDDPDRVFVSVYNPYVHQWSHARQVDVGASHLGRYVRTVAVVVTGSNEVVVVWGMSDPDFTDNDPPSGIWTASSHDFGESWSIPQRIASDCRMVTDAAASADGIIAVQIICPLARQVAVPAMVLRDADGRWHAPERLAVPVWMYSEGALVISGQGAAAQIVALTLTGQHAAPQAVLMTRPLAGGHWQVSTQTLSMPGLEHLGTRMWHVRGLTYDRVLASGTVQPGIIFMWTGADTPNGVYALSSLDGGQHWGALEAIDTTGQTGAQTLAVVPAYDPAADRLVAIYTCCADASWVWVEATHYARWSRPGSGLWYSPGGEAMGQLVPIALGARAAAATAAAQAAGSRLTWLAWVDQLQQVTVRSVDLIQLIPVSAYPAITPYTPPTGGLP